MSLISVPYHIPVMLHPTLEGLDIKSDGIYLDLTFGGGGHSRAILERLGEKGRLFAFDQDQDVLLNLPQDKRFTFVLSNFQDITQWMYYYGIDKVDGILADLGVSSHHFDEEERGFSFRFNAPLDMRMNRRGAKTASTILNTYSEEDITTIFKNYGELMNAKQLARCIVKQREIEPIIYTQQLLNLVTPFFKREREKKEVTKVFQALRICVNDEMSVLEKMLLSSINLLKEEGRLVILTYHSLEDRIVKNLMRSGRIDGKVEKDFYGKKISPLRPLNNKVIVATEEELEKNPRSRSAKLRIAIKQ